MTGDPLRGRRHRGALRDDRDFPVFAGPASWRRLDHRSNSCSCSQATQYPREERRDQSRETAEWLRWIPGSLAAEGLDARWVKKKGVHHVWYKNSLCIDGGHAFIRRTASRSTCWRQCRICKNHNGGYLPQVEIWNGVFQCRDSATTISHSWLQTSSKNRKTFSEWLIGPKCGIASLVVR